MLKYYATYDVRTDDLTKILVSALYEAHIKNDEIVRLLNKYCEVDDEKAMSLITKEKFVNVPCRALAQYLVMEKGFTSHNADVFVHNYARRELLCNPELSKLSPVKLFDVVEKSRK